MQLALFFALFVHSFTGIVTEVREVVLVGNTPARVALVQADFGQAWVILRVEPGAIADEAIVLGEAQVGDQVQVFIKGPHVFLDRVDWTLCAPADSAYCQFGSAHEDAPLSLDWNIPLSPSNEFIHYGRTVNHYLNALPWNTVVVKSSRPADIDPGRGHPTGGAWGVFRLAGAAYAGRGQIAR